MEYLDKHIKKDDINCVYGLDADLIMLSIRKHNIFFLREKTEYNIEGVNDPYMLNINLLKHILLMILKYLIIMELMIKQF